MDLNLLAISHPPFIWHNEFPPSFKGVSLPGSTIKTSLGEFGSICVQEFIADRYTIRVTVFDLIQHFISKTVVRNFDLQATLLLKGIVENTTGDTKTIVRPNRFLINNSGESTTRFRENLHIIFDTYYSAELLKELTPVFPELNNRGDFAISGNADADTLDIVHAVLRCKYDEKYRRHFYDSKVRDLLFKYLLLASELSSGKDDPTEKELDAIHKAEQIISNNISEHFSIPELSKKILLNEFRFKQLFKKIFGNGPYEYLMIKRLDKARLLLESGLSVKEVAAQVGYRPSDFTTAFRKHFGYPPSMLKK
jgi:AraC-like DNA-binding protein